MAVLVAGVVRSCREGLGAQTPGFCSFWNKQLDLEDDMQPGLLGPVGSAADAPCTSLSL